MGPYLCYVVTCCFKISAVFIIIVGIVNIYEHVYITNADEVPNINYLKLFCNAENISTLFQDVKNHALFPVMLNTVNCVSESAMTCILMITHL